MHNISTLTLFDQNGTEPWPFISIIGNTQEGVGQLTRGGSGRGIKMTRNMLLLNQCNRPYAQQPFWREIGPLLTSFTGVTNDTNEGSVPFWSNRVRVLILCMLAHWKHSHGSLRGFQMDP